MTRFLKGTCTGIHVLFAISAVNELQPLQLPACTLHKEYLVQLQTAQTKPALCAGITKQNTSSKKKKLFYEYALITSESAGLCPNLCKSKINKIV